MPAPTSPDRRTFLQLAEGNARILSISPVALAWNNLSFGGKGKGPGQFDTGHGITVPPKLKRLDIADRANGEIDRFSPDGKYLSTLNMPKDSFPCDTYYLGKYAAVRKCGV